MMEMPPKYPDRRTKPLLKNQCCKSLVTGGAGFIGSHVVDELICMGHDVVVLDDLSGGFEANINPRARLVVGSITDAVLAESLFKSYQFDYVFHLAAYAAEGLSHFIRCFNYTNNLLGTTTLINCAIRHNCRCFVFTSSIAVYGAGQVPMNEETPPRPDDPYGIAKYAVEMDLAAAYRLFGLEYVIFRPHNVYGERQNLGDRYRNVIGIFMNQIMQGLPCAIFGDGHQTRAFTHISDVAPLIARSAELQAARGQIFNIGADTPHSVNDLALLVQRAMGRTTGIRRLSARSEVLHAYSDHTKAKTLLQYCPRMSLEEGLARMATWAQQAGVRSAKEFQGIEIEDCLPESWRGCVRS